MRYTPAIVGKSAVQYRIPLYQRLFAWDQTTVEMLMSDLKKAYIDYLENDRNECPYYIGLITSTRDNDLVDGQQRFTVLYFIGLVFDKHCPGRWQSFLMVDRHPRLHFVAREKDNEYLKRLSTDPYYLERVLQDNPDEDGRHHPLMNEALATIEKALCAMELEGIELKDFSEYVFSSVSFFVSTLPYTNVRDLNSYFESLNSTGKNLEGHEILKVNLLSELKNESPEVKHAFALVWNAVADMDTPLVRRREKEDAGSLNRRFGEAIAATGNPATLTVIGLFAGNRGESVVNDLYRQALENQDRDMGDDYPSIGEIEESSEEPGKVRYGSDMDRSMLSFAEFLLHVLYLQVLNRQDREMTEDDVNKQDFFNSDHLLDTFCFFRGGMGAKEFIASLLKFRILYDYYVIRLTAAGDKYTLAMHGEETEGEMKRRVVQFESYQYVFSGKKTYYRWLCPLLGFVAGRGGGVSYEELLLFMKKNDNEKYPKTLLMDRDRFRYDQGVDRYWFWRIDYYLWQERETEFAADGDRCAHFRDQDVRKVKECVDMYTFKRNRSIEHVAARHPVKADGTDAVVYRNVHDLGNLVMISSGLNSTLKNSGYEVKRGHVEACLRDACGIESLSMLQIYLKDRDWTDDDIDHRTEEMFSFLEKSYQL